MPSPRGRYQSRILSFLSQQSMQWRDRTLRTFRHAQSTLTWGIQVVLYPVYLLFQSGRLVGQQLRATVDRLLPLLEAVKEDDFDPAVGVPPLNVDAPFHNVLDYLETFDLPIIISPRALPRSKKPQALSDCSTHGNGKLIDGLPKARPFISPADLESGHIQLHPDHAPVTDEAGYLLAQGHYGLEAYHSGESGMQQASFNGKTSQDMAVHDVEEQPIYLSRMVRGVATLLETQSLVLVDTQNQILDILTPEQQRRLYQRIAFEVAVHYRRQRLQLNAKRGRSLQRALGRGAWRFLPPPPKKEKMATPVRLFRDLMEWMQVSPIAVSANVFQESALVYLGYAQELPPPFPTPSMPPFVGNLMGHPGQPGGQSMGQLTGHPMRHPAIPAAQDISMQPPLWKRLLQAVGIAPKSTIQLSAQGTANGDRPPESSKWFDPDNHGSVMGWLNANQFSEARRQAEQFLANPSLPHRSRWIPNWGETIQGSDSIIEDPVQPTSPDESARQGGVQGHGAIAPSPRGTTARAPRGVVSQTSSTPGHVAQSGGIPGTPSMAYGGAPEDALLHPTHLPDEDPGDLFTSADPADRDASMLPTLVDTQATLVGYVKHPLEQILEWIDLGMLWIEEVAAKTWNWLKTVLQSDKN